MLDFCIIGSGVSGSTIARLLSKKYNVEKLTLYQTNKDGSVCKHSCKYYFYYRPEKNFLSLAMSNMACSFTSIEKLETV